MGYSLGRSSVPLCEGVDEEDLQRCFLKKRKNFIWENRDFTVESDVVLRYIEKFVLFGRDRQKTCEELKDQLDQRFVLYNVWCSKPRKWYPTLLDGEKACAYGATYPVDHTSDVKTTLFLYDKRKDCCAAFPEACLSDTDSNALRKKDFPGSTYSLFHSYHELSNEKEVEAVPVKDKPKRKRHKTKDKLSNEKVAETVPGIDTPKRDRTRERRLRKDEEGR